MATLRAALDATLAAEAAEAEAAVAAKAAEVATTRVATALAALSGTADLLPDPVPEARRRRAALDRQRKRIESRSTAASLVEAMASDVARLEAAEAVARMEHDRLVTGLWCADLAPVELLRVIDQLADLADLHRQCEALTRRVRQLEAALAAFEARARDLRQALGPDGTEPIAAILRLARARAAAAEESRRKAETLTEQRDERVTPGRAPARHHRRRRPPDRNPAGRAGCRRGCRSDGRSRRTSTPAIACGPRSPGSTPTAAKPAPATMPRPCPAKWTMPTRPGPRRWLKPGTRPRTGGTSRSASGARRRMPATRR